MMEQAMFSFTTPFHPFNVESLGSGYTIISNCEEMRAKPKTHERWTQGGGGGGLVYPQRYSSDQYTLEVLNTHPPWICFKPATYFSFKNDKL